MTGYTKLFGSIIASTIWSEDNETRLVWITMLAMRNERHIVEGSIPGLAVLARVSIEGCRTAITKLSSPDPDSRSKEHEGRRITAVDGGWLILNGEKYRQKMNEDERREYKRLKQQEYRSRGQSVDTCGQMLTNVDSVDTDRDRDRDRDREKEKEENPLTPKGEESEASSARDIFVGSWNIARLQQIKNFGANRKKTFATRMKEPFFRDHWKDGIDRVQKSAFCQGSNERGWVANVDWFLRPGTLEKILEGKYDRLIKESYATHQRNNATRPDRNSGTCNEGKSHLYGKAATGQPKV